MRTFPLLALFLLLGLCLLCACPPGGPDRDPSAWVEPGVAPQTGYEPLILDVEADGLTADAVLAVSVGGVAAYDLTPLDDGRLQVTHQGAPDPGAVDVVLETADGRITWDGALELQAPPDPVFARVMSIGASLTQGVIDATPTKQTVLQGPSLAFARATGAWIPQPLLVDPLFPSMPYESVGPAPECRAASAVDFISSSITDVLVNLSDGSELDYALGRIDPEVPHGNIATGNMRIGDMLEAPGISAFVETFLGHLAYEPDATFGEALERSQVDIVEEVQPTLVFTTDAYGNDALGGVANGDARPERLPDLQELEPKIEELVDRLAATGAEVFIADLPDPGVLPKTRGADPDDLAGVTAKVESYNAALATHAADHDNVHVVPVFAMANDVRDRGLVVDGEALEGSGTHMLGGLLSFDGLHFSPTGYALLANVILDTVDEALGTETGRVDVRAVYESDPHAPPTLRAQGIDPDACR